MRPTIDTEIGRMVDTSAQDNRPRLSPTQRLRRMAVQMNQKKEKEMLEQQEKYEIEAKVKRERQMNEFYERSMPDTHKEPEVTAQDSEEVRIKHFEKTGEMVGEDFFSYEESNKCFTPAQMNWLRKHQPRRYDNLLKKGCFDNVEYAEDKGLIDETGTTTGQVLSKEEAEEKQAGYNEKAAILKEKSRLESEKRQEAYKGRTRPTPAVVLDKGA